jgi:ATP-dependent Lon protease
MEEIGLFPLDVVLFPGERLPLHIFEPRYRELIEECLAQSSEFGLIYQQGVAMRAAGTRAGVEEVLRRYPDGTLDIVVVGGGRFRLVEETEGRSFITARVEEIEDLDDPPLPEDLAACREAMQRVMAVVGEDASTDPAYGSFAVGARLALPAELKQELLEMLSERDRILRLTKELAGPVIEGVRAREVARRASGNGQVERL